MRPARLIVLLLFGLGLFCWGVSSRPLSESIAASVNEPVSRTFVVFDGTLYKQKPDLSQYGVRPITILYENRFWPSGQAPTNLPEQGVVRALAAEVASSLSPVVIDIERWPVKGTPSLIQSSVTQYRTVLQWFREAAPGLRIGFYGTVPVPDYWRAIQEPTSADYKAWQQDNDRLDLIGKEVDAIFPSIYTFYADRQGWVTYATAQISEARRKANGKPVYAFIWPQYHESNPLLAGRFLDAEYWELELLTARQYADGLVIWGGWGTGGPQAWDEDAHWWQVTKSLLPKMRIFPLKPPRDVSVH
jgi:hypothetical protein